MPDKKLKDISEALYHRFIDMDIEECEEIIKAAKELNHTNCWFDTFWCKDAIIKLAESRLQDLILKNNSCSKNH